MKGIALRFFEKFVPTDGTIAEHKKMDMCIMVRWEVLCLTKI